VLAAVLDYFLIDQRCCAFFGGENYLSGHAHDKARELEAKEMASRERLMDACAGLLHLASRRKKARRA